jgi:hypothetical protein
MSQSQQTFKPTFFRRTEWFFWWGGGLLKQSAGLNVGWMSATAEVSGQLFARCYAYSLQRYGMEDDADSTFMYDGMAD